MICAVAWFGVLAIISDNEEVVLGYDNGTNDGRRVFVY